MQNKLWLGFIVVYVVLMATNFLIHDVMLSSTYQGLVENGIMRGPEAGTMWIYFVTALIVAFFFTLIYSKGHEGKGIGEGLRFGFYAGVFMATPFAYDTYASVNIPYHLAMQWFISIVVQYIILGMIVSMVYGRSPAPRAS